MESPKHRAREVAVAFLLLGCTSFGGPLAHLEFFRREFVERRGWLSAERFAELLALSQFLPGPSSSQLGFAIGLERAGWRGACAAFLAFTLPSALLLLVALHALPRLPVALQSALAEGLALVALMAVASAVFAMVRSTCVDLARTSIALGALLVLLQVDAPSTQLAVIGAGALLGLACVRPESPAGVSQTEFGPSLRAGAWMLAGCVVLLGLSLGWQPVGRLPGGLAALVRAGSSVFGGGHVVLPMLEGRLVDPGWLTREEFLADYGAAQVVPGPLFSFAAPLGARLAGGDVLTGVAGAGLALLALFLPGLLLIGGVLPFWSRLRDRVGLRRAVAGTGAAVTGLLAAALVDPLAVHAVHGLVDALLVVAGIGLLALGRRRAHLVVAGVLAVQVLRALSA